MINLIENLNLHKTNENEELVDELIYCIKENNIDNLEQLIAFEDKKFTVEGKVLNSKERIKYCFLEIENSYYDYDGMLLEEIKELKKLKESILLNIDEQTKILNLIKIYMITNREIMFFNEIYEFITKGIL